MADVLAASIVDDVELQRGIIEVLKDRDEQSRVDRATGVNGLVLCVLFHCHQKDQRKFVREIAATANRLYAEEGESLRLSSETVGHALRTWVSIVIDSAMPAEVLYLTELLSLRLIG